MMNETRESLAKYSASGSIKNSLFKYTSWNLWPELDGEKAQLNLLFPISQMKSVSCRLMRFLEGVQRFLGNLAATRELGR